jgi:cytochrome b involved in lipid metabolism
MLLIRTVLYFLLVNTVYFASAAAGGKTFTMAEVESQKLTVFSGNVYDLTKYADEHPGGAGKIKKLMGTDGTTKLKKKHGLGYLNQIKGSMVGTLGENAAANAVPTPAQSGAAEIEKENNKGEKKGKKGKMAKKN